MTRLRVFNWVQQGQHLEAGCEGIVNVGSFLCTRQTRKTTSLKEVERG